MANVVFLIQEMDCPTEERLIRGRLEGMAGVEARPMAAPLAGGPCCPRNNVRTYAGIALHQCVSSQRRAYCIAI